MSGSGRHGQWTRPSVVEALLLFHSRHGRWPKASEWATSAEKRGREYPGYDAVRSLFAGWDEAIAAAMEQLPNDRYEAGIAGPPPDADWLHTVRAPGEVRPEPVRENGKPDRTRLVARTMLDLSAIRDCQPDEDALVAFAIEIVDRVLDA